MLGALTTRRQLRAFELGSKDTGGMDKTFIRIAIGQEDRRQADKNDEATA
jgi:hypothetical protein